MKIIIALSIIIGMVSNTTIDQLYPPELNAIYDYYEGLQISKKSEKPIFLFFTGSNCKNPKIANELIEKDNEIVNQLNNLFVPVILDVDDETKLKKEKTVLEDGKEISIRTKGNEWAYIEISKFNNNSQPFILLINSNEEILKSPLNGKISKEQIIDFLNF